MSGEALALRLLHKGKPKGLPYIPLVKIFSLKAGSILQIEPHIVMHSLL